MLFRLSVFGAIAIAAPLSAQEIKTAPPAVAAFSKADTPLERDQVYVTQVRESDFYEVASSRLVLQRSRNRELRSFAQTMIRHHTRATDDFARITPSGARITEADLSEPKSQMLEKLRDSPPVEFAGNYVQGQVAVHEEALALHRAYLTTGADRGLRLFAGQAATLIGAHLAAARSLGMTSR